MPAMSESIASLITRDAHRLEAVSASPLLDCQMLMGYVLGKDRSWLYAHDHENLTAPQRRSYESLLARRTAGEPVAYLTGHREFWNRRFIVSPATLIPRPETELLISTLLDRFDNAARTVVDLGTGSGNIAISLAAERPAWQVTGTDVSEAALKIAAENSVGLSNVHWRQARWCAGLEPASVDILVSNPPYIRADDPHLKYLTFEPRDALASGTDGLEAIREIVVTGYDCLKPGGCLMLEHGYDQQEAVQELMQAQGYRNIERFTDLDGTPRAVLGLR